MMLTLVVVQLVPLTLALEVLQELTIPGVGVSLALRKQAGVWLATRTLVVAQPELQAAGPVVLLVCLFAR